MALDPIALKTPYTPEWWMDTLAKRMLDRSRLLRFGILEAYRAGCPPLVTATESQRTTFQAFNRVSRSNFARPVVRALVERLAVRAIRTAAVNDDAGDSVAWRYWTGCGLNIAAPDVHSDMGTFSEAVVRVGVRADGSPVALRRDPRYVVTEQDPFDPLRTIAALELMWDPITSTDYALLWLPGEEHVATRERKTKPPTFQVPGILAEDRRQARLPWFPRLSFEPSQFTMRPNVDDVPEELRDSAPYSRTLDQPVVPVVRLTNRDGVGEFEEHLDLIDCISFLDMLLNVVGGVQAYKQRSLQQDANDGQDRLPDKNPNTGEPINWDEIFQPGPDALWKLPPGVTIHESGQVDMQGLLSAIESKIKRLSTLTNTPFALLSDDVNQSAEGAQAKREGLVLKVEDRQDIAGFFWPQVMSLVLSFAPEADRYDANGNDRADAGRMIFDWKPADRPSLAEKAGADAQNKTLSVDMAAQKIWGLTPDEVAINRAQKSSDALLAAALAPAPAPQGSPTGGNPVPAA